MAKVDEEITIELDCPYEIAHNILINNGFRYSYEYLIKDIYMLEKSCKKSDPLEILEESVIIRDYTVAENGLKQIIIKQKKYNKKGDIISQKNTCCKIDSVKEAISLFKALGYYQFLKINDLIKVYKGNDEEFVLQLVNDRHLYLEFENRKGIDNFEEYAKYFIKQTKLPQKGDDYFVKKAVIEMKEQEEKNKKI